MNFKGRFITAIAALFAMAIAGCGGGGGAPQGASGFAKGVVTAKGSVTVNGVKFDDSAASIKVDDNPSGTDAMLKVGMVVKIKGRIDDASKTGVAQQIEFTDNLEGPVTSKDPTTNTLVIFGQTVKVDITTVFEGFSGFADPALAAGARVEVSGFPDSNGVIRASRIENKAGAADDFEIKGTVSNFTAGGTTFTVTPPNAATGIGVTLGAGVTLPTGFANGKLVEVKTTGSGTAITATKVELEVELEAAENERVEVEGFVTDVNTTTKTFVVNNVTVDASAIAMPTLGQKVEVEGQFVNGRLVPAKPAEVEIESNIEVEGNLAAAADIDSAASTIKLNGVTLVVNSTTMFKDSDSSGGKTPVANFGMANIAAGNHLQISAFLDTSVTPNRLVATFVERRQADTTTFVQGPVTFVDTINLRLTLLGSTANPIIVQTQAGTTQFRRSSTGADIGPFAVFASFITEGFTVVKAKGTFVAPNSINPTQEVDLE